MPLRTPAHIARRRLPLIVAACTALVAGCTSGGAAASGSPTAAHSASGPATTSTPPPRPATSPSTTPSPTVAPTPTSTAHPGDFTIAFAGDVHFAGRVARRLAHPASAFAQAAPGLRKADLTMVNLETAITTGGTKAPKEFTFRAPPAAFTALRDAGIDIATMANNHGVDYGAAGLRDTLAAIKASRFPVVGIGRDAEQAYAPWTTTLHGTKIAILAASQVRDETLANWTAGASSPGIASAYSHRLIQAVKRAKTAGYLVIVYLHWGIEFRECPTGEQEGLAARLARAGAAAIIGTHAHVLQGAGWRRDGSYVAYGLGNYLWWRSFGNDQDDNGVLTLHFRADRVVAAHFAPSHLDDRGVPLPATGATKRRIAAEWRHDVSCTDLTPAPPHK